MRIDEMTIIPKKGCMMCSRLQGYDKFYYDHIGWYKGFKFVFGRFKGDSWYRMFEVSTRAAAAEPTESSSISVLVTSFSLKLGAAGDNIAEVVQRFFDKNRDKHVVPLWLSTLIG